jgi:UDP-N-acetylmuramate--alanine ligase
MPGWINIENAIAALAVAVLLNVDKEEINEALPKFRGNKRRFEIQLDEEKKYIDDYAHHPKEIEKLLLGIDKLYPNKKVLGIFQPHLYSRTKDFARDFAKSLSSLDELFLLPIYPAREESKDFEGISSSTIYNLLDHKENCKLVEKENLIIELQKAEYDIVLSIGAGDIDQFVSQIKETIQLKK